MSATVMARPPNPEEKDSFRYTHWIHARPTLAPDPPQWDWPCICKVGLQQLFDNLGVPVPTIGPGMKARVGWRATPNGDVYLQAHTVTYGADMVVNDKRYYLSSKLARQLIPAGVLRCRGELVLQVCYTVPDKCWRPRAEDAETDTSG